MCTGGITTPNLKNTYYICVYINMVKDVLTCKSSDL